jgi:dolichyl-phosphate-mannose-protein mannosyltransferase
MSLSSRHMQLNQEMLSANARITQRHHWDSVWYEWPLNLRGVLYYSKDLGHTYTATVYLLGNPLVLWIVAAAMCVALVVMGVYCRSRRFSSLPEHAAFERWTPAFTVLIYCMLGYACNMVPYALVTRSCFLYHYMPALMYGQLLTATLVDMLAGRKWMPKVTRILISIVCICYVFYAPWIYAIRMYHHKHTRYTCI